MAKCFKSNCIPGNNIYAQFRTGLQFFLPIILLLSSLLIVQYDTTIIFKTTYYRITPLITYRIPAFFYHKDTPLNGQFWDKISELSKEQIEYYLKILFPNAATDKSRIEREFFFDKEKHVENEYVDEHQEWPDETYIMDAPNNQKVGHDTVPGIKDVQHLIHKHQFPMSCSNKKFLAPPPLYSGFGSVNHLLGAMLGQAIIEDRIFLYGTNNLIYNNGPYCGGNSEKIHNEYIQKMINRSHSHIERKQMYYDGSRPNGFDCFYEKITNCSISNQSGDIDIKYYKPSDNHIVPDIIKPIIQRLNIPNNISYYYWRLCATPFFYRLNSVAKQWIKEYEEDYLVNPVDHYDVSIHLRHGEKSSEMKLVYGDDVMGAINIIKKLTNKDKLNIFLSSEDRNVIDWFLENTNHSITFFDFQLENFHPNQYTRLASVLVPQMLSNMKHSLFSTYIIGTIGSNWNRLMIELRMTTAGYANNYYFEVGDHACVSIEHCRFLQKDFHMNW